MSEPRRRGRMPSSGASLGPSVDVAGSPVIDPTENVLSLVEAAVKRLDDLGSKESSYLRQMAEKESTHLREIINVRAVYEEKLREQDAKHAENLRQQEAARIDAIRAVDVAAVGRAAEVSQQQANTLSAQVASTAEAMRNQVATTAAAWSESMRTSLEPIQKSIEDLRKAQYEQQGQKSAQSEGKDNSQWVFMAVIGVAVIVVQIFLHYVGK